MEDTNYKLYPIPNYENCYSITEDGQVWSHYRNKFLKSYLNKDGYAYIDLSKNGKQKRFTIHKLVALTFLPEPTKEQTQVNHIDENKLNNHKDNLEWVTPKENINHGTGHARGMAQTAITQRNRPDISKKVRCIETQIIYDSTREAQRQLNIDCGSIGRVCNGRRKTAGGYHWEWI